MALQPPRRIDTERLVVRRWTLDDATAMHAAITASTEHLRPWMPWIAFEPKTVDERRDLIADWSVQWDAGEEFPYALFDRDERLVLGGSGLHRRVGDDGLEIGYWVHVEHVGRGFATEAARALTAAALALPGITTVVIRHDRANLASGAVPRKLGYRFDGERPVEPQAPAETGVQCWWSTGALRPA